MQGDKKKDWQMPEGVYKALNRDEILTEAAM